VSGNCIFLSFFRICSGSHKARNAFHSVLESQTECTKRSRGSTTAPITSICSSIGESIFWGHCQAGILTSWALPVFDLAQIFLQAPHEISNSWTNRKFLTHRRIGIVLTRNHERTWRPKTASNTVVRLISDNGIPEVILGLMGNNHNPNQGA
jgi:hypothetical protein